MIRTRKKSVGREPSLRDEILSLLIDYEQPMTAKDIALQLQVNKTTPFRPLADLVQMQLVIKNEDGIDGAEFSVNKEQVEKLKEVPRRTRE